jgi:hypothetical protein
MNLIQIQDRLKDLPMQAIMGYANGQNPQVPPYLALGELNRRKQMEQKSTKAPQGTVKENIEQQVGLMSLQKLRQGQMAQQSAMQGAQAPTIPENTPEPTEQPQEEMAMAAGGLTRLPVRSMNFGSGGIIAFANGGPSLDPEDPNKRVTPANIPFDPATATRRADFASAPQETTPARRFLEAQMGNQDRSNIPEEFAPSKQTPIGQEYLKYLEERQGSFKEDERKFKEKEASRAKRDFFQSLIESGEATRGQRGIGALFGGYGRSAGKFANEADERQSAFDKVRQERSDTDAKLKYEIDNLRRAEARGDAKTVYESKVKIAELTQAKDQMRLTAGQKLAGLESAEGISALDITSREKIAKLDRESRAAVSRMPSAEQQLIERAIASYREKNPGTSFYDAYQAIKTIPANAKAVMTRDQAADNVRKNLENIVLGGKLMKQASEALKANGNPNPNVSQIQEYLIQLEMNPSSGAPTASSGKAPPPPTGYKVD